MTPKSPDRQCRTALFAGSFDPFTRGHDAIVRRGLELFDRVVVVVGINASKATDNATARRRATDIAALYANTDGRVEVMAWDGLMAECARQVGACCMLRGVRSARDFEYERDMADVNRRLYGIDTVMLPADPELASLSSSVVRELASYGADVSQLLP